MSKHFQLSVMALLVFATFGTAFAQQYYSGEISVSTSICVIIGDKYDLICHKNTNGYSPNFLKLAEVKQNCQEALVDGWLLGYCSKELGTL